MGSAVSVNSSPPVIKKYPPISYKPQAWWKLENTKK